MRSSVFVFILLACGLSLRAQFAPPAGMPGTTAIHKDSSAIIGWASGCTIQRGWQDISDPSAGFASVGDSTSAIGPAATNGIVSLGDSGVAILSFNPPITDASGYDLAVFENSFSNDFLELGLVEVSSDGVNFFRFPATSHTQDTAQTSGFGLTDATKINNLAGKYRGNFGTPFDLQELSGQAGLDISQITHVKIIDVIGSIGAHASSDAFGHKINDPYPTPFPSGGFDLDAVAVLHQAPSGVKESNTALAGKFYPNPAHDRLTVAVADLSESMYLRVVSATGITCLETTLNTATEQIDISGLAPGIYFAEIGTKTKKTIKKLIIQ